MKTFEEKLETAKKQKYYEYTYQYTRYNPQLGSYKATSTVIAHTDKEAEKLAKKACEGAIYGSNSFDFIIKKSEALTLDVDYTLTRGFKKDCYGYVRDYYVKAEKIYK